MKKGNTCITYQQTIRLIKLIEAAGKTGQSLSSIAAQNPEFTKSVVIKTNKKLSDPKFWAKLYRIAKIRLLLLRAKRLGLSLTQLHSENPDIPYHDFCHWNSIFEILPIVGRKNFSDDKKKEILVYAAIHGVIKASMQYGVSTTYIYMINEEFKILTLEEKTYRTDEEKKKIAKYAALNGIAAAAHEFDVNDSLISDWKRKYLNFVPAPVKRIRIEDKIKAATQVRKINQEYGGFSGMRIVSKQTGISSQELYRFNIMNNRSFFETMYNKDFRMTSPDMQRIIINGAEYFKSIHEMSRAYKIDRAAVSSILKSNGVTVGRKRAPGASIPDNIIQELVDKYHNVSVMSDIFDIPEADIRKMIESRGYMFGKNGCLVTPVPQLSR